MKRRVMAVLICMLLVMSGCGGKDTSAGVGSGNDAAPNSEAEADASRQLGQDAENQNAEESSGADSASDADNMSGAETSQPADSAVKAAPQIEVETVYLSDGKTESPDEISFKFSYDKVSLTGDGYEALAQTLSWINEDWEEEMQWMYEYELDYLDDEWADTDAESRKDKIYEVRNAATIVRADAQIVSIRYDQYINLGWDEPTIYVLSANINAQSGERLLLEELFEGKGLRKACAALVDELEAHEGDYKGGFYENYAEEIENYFYGEYTCAWFYKEDTLGFAFAPYALSSFESGVIEAEISLEGIELAKLDEDGEIREVHVSTAEEFMDAISKNTTIIMAPGIYDLSEWADEFGQRARKYISFSDTQININRVKNLQIVAERPELPTQIVIQNSWDDVLSFQNCRHIVMEGIVMGHAVEPGYCSGDVLEFNHCSDVTLRNMDLYGCGAYGITAYQCSDFDVEECWIHDCTYGIMYISNSVDMNFKDTWFTYCKEYTLLDGGGSSLVFENCTFDKNWGDEFVPNPVNYDVPSDYTFINCRFLGGENLYLDPNSPYVTVINGGI